MAVVVGLAAAGLLAGCAVGPDFERPAAPDATRYTREPLGAGTTSAPVAGGQAQRFVTEMRIPDQWWTLFHSRELNALIERAIKANPSLEQAIGALRVAEENARAVPHVTPEALRPLMAYSWPGNVRELENVIERAVVLSSGPEISVELLPDSLMGRGSSLTLHDPPSDASLFEIVEDVERRVITDMLERCNWNQTEAAERFHVPLSTLNQKIRRLNIEIRKKGRG